MTENQKSYDVPEKSSAQLIAAETITVFEELCRRFDHDDAIQLTAAIVWGRLGNENPY